MICTLMAHLGEPFRLRLESEIASAILILNFSLSTILHRPLKRLNDSSEDIAQSISESDKKFPAACK